MRGITLGVFSAQPIYDVDFQTNVLDVAQTMGYAIPPLEKRLLLNRLMVDMKNIGFFQIQDTLSNFALGIAGFEQFRMIDWKKTGNIYTPVDNPIFTPQGVEGDGVAAYINTNFNPATMGVNYTLNNAGRGFVIVQPFSDPISEAAGATASNRTNIGAGGSSVQRINSGPGSSSVSVNLSGNGLKTISRDSIDSIRLTNKEEETNVTQPSNGIANETQHLLRTQSLFSTNTFLNYLMGASMTYEQTQSFRTIYNQFLSDSGLSPIA